MSCRILICDDNDDDVYFLLHALKSADLSVDSTRARDGEEAFAYLSNGEKYDLVILDQHLPRKSGKEVIELVRSLGKFPSCPIVVFTSTLGKEEEDLRGLGVQLVLEKPFSLEGYQEIGESLAKLCP